MPRARTCAHTRPGPMLFASPQVWYGHRYTHTLVLDMPMPEGAQNATPYSRRGW